MIKDWWGSFTVSGKRGQKLRLKLKLLRDKLCIWNKEVFGNVDLKKKHLLGEITTEEQRSLQEGER